MVNVHHETHDSLLPWDEASSTECQRSEAVEVTNLILLEALVLKVSKPLVSAGIRFAPGLQEGLLSKSRDLAAISTVGPLPARGAFVNASRGQEQSSGPLRCP